jgi:hypothetical protein
LRHQLEERYLGPAAPRSIVEHYLKRSRLQCTRC